MNPLIIDDMPKIILGVKLYSYEETLGLLGITRSTLTKYIQAKRIASTMIGGKKYFSEENIKAFLLSASY